MVCTQNLCSQPLNYEYPSRTIGDTSRKSPTESEQIECEVLPGAGTAEPALAYADVKTADRAFLPKSSPHRPFPQAAPSWRV